MTFATQRSLLPSLGALQAFEAAARHGSFTRAAEELNLTQGAVSRQVAALEQTLGVPLFERVRQRVTLTPAGLAYAAEVRDALSRIAAATMSAMAFRGAGGTLALAILPTFGTRWLIPRLPDFFQKHPEVTINFATRIRPFDFRQEPLDAAIHFGDPHWPGAAMHRLMGEVIVPVASPALIARVGLKAPPTCCARRCSAVDPPARLGRMAGAQGLAPAQALLGPSFEQFAMVAQAAVAGLGMAIVPRMLVEEELRSGALAVPFDRPIDSRQGYWLVYPEEKRDPARRGLPGLAARAMRARPRLKASRQPRPNLPIMRSAHDRGPARAADPHSARRLARMTSLTASASQPSAAPTSADVVIVGGAAIGSSIACHIAADPAFKGRVVVVEKDPTYQFSASALSAASIRQQYSSAVNIRISLYGVQFLRRIGELLAVGDDRPEIGLVEGGYLYLASPEGEAALRANNALQAAEGADIVLFERDALAARFRWLAADDLACGTWGRSGEGWFDGWGLMQAFRKKARGLGVAYVDGTVSGIDRDGARVRAVRLADGSRIACGALVNAAGASGGRQVAAMAGVAIPVHSRKRFVFSFTCKGPVENAPLVIDTRAPGSAPRAGAAGGPVVHRQDA